MLLLGRMGILVEQSPLLINFTKILIDLPSVEADLMIVQRGITAFRIMLQRQQHLAAILRHQAADHRQRLRRLDPVVVQGNRIVADLANPPDAQCSNQDTRQQQGRKSGEQLLA